MAGLGLVGENAIGCHPGRIGFVRARHAIGVSGHRGAVFTSASTAALTQTSSVGRHLSTQTSSQSGTRATAEIATIHRSLDLLERSSERRIIGRDHAPVSIDQIAKEDGSENPPEWTMPQDFKKANRNLENLGMERDSPVDGALPLGPWPSIIARAGMGCDPDEVGGTV